VIDIVCYAGGTCGDIITAMLDSRDAKFTNKSVWVDPDRSRLKKPHGFTSSLDKDQYITDMSLLYNSIPSHDLSYHAQNKHPFISITVNDFSLAVWAAERFKKLHRPHVWAEMCQVCGASSIEEYAQILLDYSTLVKQHTDKLIALERIMTGHAVEDLAQFTKHNLDNSFYEQWIKLQNYAG